MRSDETTVTKEEHGERTMKTSRSAVKYFFSSGCLQKEVQRDRSYSGKTKLFWSTVGFLCFKIIGSLYDSQDLLSTCIF